MKRDWTRCWLKRSAAAAGALAACGLLPFACAHAANLAAYGQQKAAGAAQPAGEKKRVNELTLAGLRPGKDTLQVAAKTFKLEERAQSSKPDAPEWADSCSGRLVHLELGAGEVIESVTVSALAPAQADCRATPPAWLQPKNLRSGRGIGLGSAKAAVLRAYGAPQSSGPATHSGREMELLYFAFDWAGSDVPQVLEVMLDRGRVVQMTLAFPSL